MNFERLSIQLIRHLRGQRSQLGFSRRLGYRSNVAYSWESGRRAAGVSVLLRAAQANHIDLAGGLRRLYRGQDPPGDPRDLATWARLLDAARGSRRIEEIAAAVGCSRYAASRWLKAEVEPRLADWLRLVEACTQRLLDVVAVFADPAALPVARQPWRRLEAARSLFYEQPDAQLVLLALELEGEAGPPRDAAWLAQRTGLSIGEVESMMRALSDTGQIRRVGGRWIPHAVQTIDTRRHPDAGRVLRRWATQRALRVIEAGGEGQFSFNVFTVSDADLQQLMALQREHWARTRALIARSGPGERIVLCNNQLFPIDDRTSDRSG